MLLSVREALMEEGKKLLRTEQCTAAAMAMARRVAHAQPSHNARFMLPRTPCCRHAMKHVTCQALAARHARAVAAPARAVAAVDMPMRR